MRPAFCHVALACGYFACATAGAAQDQDLMIKWTSYTIVRYNLVGEYTGDPVITTASTGWRVTSHVTDRVELVFDWNQNETALVGKVAIKNTTSTVGTPQVPDLGRQRGACAAPRVSGAYEHLTIDSVTPLANTLQVVATRSHPAGVVPYIGEDGKCTNDAATARTARDEFMLQVLPAMMLGMPQALGEGMSVSKDVKSLIYEDKNSGWTWTYTFTGVR